MSHVLFFTLPFAKESSCYCQSYEVNQGIKSTRVIYRRQFGSRKGFKLSSSFLNVSYAVHVLLVSGLKNTGVCQKNLKDRIEQRRR
jgi:hypothetical protein